MLSAQYLSTNVGERGAQCGRALEMVKELRNAGPAGECSARGKWVGSLHIGQEE